MTDGVVLALALFVNVFTTMNVTVSYGLCPIDVMDVLVSVILHSGCATVFLDLVSLLLVAALEM